MGNSGKNYWKNFTQHAAGTWRWRIFNGQLNDRIELGRKEYDKKKHENFAFREYPIPDSPVESIPREISKLRKTKPLRQWLFELDSRISALENSGKVVPMEENKLRKKPDNQGSVLKFFMAKPDAYNSFQIERGTGLSKNEVHSALFHLINKKIINTVGRGVYELSKKEVNKQGETK